ncbi:hypothetical protein AA313_de0208684 [Arthrobotrys entomopaga]|nr:hypothetical protein AA313_de0208684 [Arthrobotrys entomopaga]
MNFSHDETGSSTGQNMHTDSPHHILLLPTETQTSILSHLPFHTILAASVTCKKWHGIIKTTKLFKSKTYDDEGFHRLLRNQNNIQFVLQNDKLQVFDKSSDRFGPVVDISQSPTLDEGVLMPGYELGSGGIISSLFFQGNDRAGMLMKEFFEPTQTVSVGTLAKNVANAALKHRIKKSKKLGGPIEEREIKMNTKVRIYCFDVFRRYEDDSSLSLLWGVSYLYEPALFPRF